MAWTAPKTWAFQEGVESSELNIHLRDNLNAIGNHFRLYKTADQSVTSSITLIDDTHLTFAIAANEVWAFTLTLQIVAGAGGFNRTIAGPAGATGFWNEAYTVTADSKVTGFSKAIGTATSESSGRTGNDHQINGTIINAGTAGNCRLQWAQAVSNGTATTVKLGSHLIAHRIA